MLADVGVVDSSTHGYRLDEVGCGFAQHRTQLLHLAIMSMLFAARGRPGIDLVAHNTREVRDRRSTVAGALSALLIYLKALAAMAVTG